jgi:hypothetical protein
MLEYAQAWDSYVGNVDYNCCMVQYYSYNVVVFKETPLRVCVNTGTFSTYWIYLLYIFSVL